MAHDIKRILQASARRKGLEPGSAAYETYVGATLRRIGEHGHSSAPKHETAPQAEQKKLKLVVHRTPKQTAADAGTREAGAYMRDNPGKSHAELIELATRNIDGILAEDVADARDESAGGKRDHMSAGEVRAYIDTSDPSLPARKTVTINGKTVYKGSQPWTEIGGKGTEGHSTLDGDLREVMHRYGAEPDDSIPGGELESFKQFLQSQYKLAQADKYASTGKRERKRERAAQAVELEKWTRVVDGLKSDAQREDIVKRSHDAADALVEALEDKELAREIIKDSWSNDDELKAEALKYLNG